jgi:quercetin dioxygenase-like cupin family protein
MAKAKRKTKATRANSKKSKKKISAKSAARAKTRKPQRFVVSHHREEDFDHGLRPYSAYRDLGIAPATGGMVQAHVIRMTKPFSAEEVAIPHFHDVDFQMVYVLKGWFRSEFEGQGPHTFHAGSCWIQPPRIKHTVLGYSDDCELLEIVLPADFETVTLR